MAKADLHNHLRTSSNLKHEDFNLAIDIASKKLGKNGKENSIFGLANFYDKRYEQFIGLKGYERTYVGENRTAIYIPEKKVLVVKAQEVPTKQGHVLVLGLGDNVHIKRYITLEDTLKEAEDKNGVIVADHPFFISGIGPYLQQHAELLEHLDAIEIHNGEAIYGNRKAKEFYAEQKPSHIDLGALSSSDGHSFYELAKNWTEINFPDIEQPKEFLQSLKKSIRNTNQFTPRKNYISYFGFIDHATDLVFITKIAPRIGLKKLFETDRPD